MTGASRPFPPFVPARWLRGPHAQTIGPALFPARAVSLRPEVLDVPVAPGTSIRVLIDRPASPARGTLVAIHGLAGSAESRYMRRTATLALERGWVTARVNLRNCGGTESMASTLYNAGQADDAGAVLEALETQGLPRPYALLGFSLGGNLALKYAGATGSTCRADAVCGVNPPVDLFACIDALERRSNALYHAYFTRELCRHLRRIRRIRPVAGPEATPRSVPGVRAFDELFTAPDAGYAGASAYYAAASAGPLLSGLARRAIVLSADDDPFVPVACFASLRGASRRLTLSHPRGGGHCGYWQAGHPRYWAAVAAIAFFERGDPD